MSAIVFVENTTNRRIHLGGTVVLMPGERVNLAPDARYVLKRPLFKSYVKSGDLKIERQSAGKQKLTGEKKETKDQ